MYYDNNSQEGRFLEMVRQGWHLNPEVLEALKSGETTPEEQARAYADVNEIGTLTVEDATSLIERAIQDPEY